VFLIYFTALIPLHGQVESCPACMNRQMIIKCSIFNTLAQINSKAKY